VCVCVCVCAHDGSLNIKLICSKMPTKSMPISHVSPSPKPSSILHLFTPSPPTPTRATATPTVSGCHQERGQARPQAPPRGEGVGADGGQHCSGSRSHGQHGRLCMMPCDLSVLDALSSGPKPRRRTITRSPSTPLRRRWLAIVALVQAALHSASWAGFPPEPQWWTGGRAAEMQVV
jgi:hypothetical protein